MENTTSDQSGSTKTFHVKIDATIEAEDLEAAFYQIGRYYLFLSAGITDQKSPYTSGSASINVRVRVYDTSVAIRLYEEKARN